MIVIIFIASWVGTPQLIKNDIRKRRPNYAEKKRERAQGNYVPSAYLSQDALEKRRRSGRESMQRQRAGTTGGPVVQPEKPSNSASYQSLLHSNYLFNSNLF